MGGNRVGTGAALAALLAVTACTGGGSPAPTPTETTTSQARVYSEDDLRNLVSGLRDAEGRELRLVSPDEVEQGQQLAEVLLGQASVEPQECESIAKAGLLDTVEEGEVAVAITEGDDPTSASAQSNANEPDAPALLEEIRGQMDSCTEFALTVAGQEFNVTSEELQAQTDGEADFATLSTRDGDRSQMLMQVSAAQGALLVVATRAGADLGDQEQRNLEDLVNEILAKAQEETGGTETGTQTATPTDGTATPTDGATSPDEETSPAETRSPEDSPAQSPEQDTAAPSSPQDSPGTGGTGTGNGATGSPTP